MHPTFLEYSRLLREWLGRNAWRVALLFVGILLPLVFFGMLADEIHEGESFSWDESVLLYLHRNSTPQLDWLIVNGERLGGFLTIPFFVTVVLALRFLKRVENATFFFFAVVGAYTLNVLAKLFFQRERPALWESPLPETNFSFPSGHAMVSMAVAVAFIELAWRTKWRWPVVALGLGSTLIVGVSRLYLGVHYPSDVLAGWSAALVWTCGLYFLLRRSKVEPVAVS
jgi:membrane-associated phospholipid phosphatase